MRLLLLNPQSPHPHLLIHLLQTRDDSLEQRFGKDWRNRIPDLLSERLLRAGVVLMPSRKPLKLALLLIREGPQTAGVPVADAAVAGDAAA